MNTLAKIAIGHSACPHDCPSTCALDVELLATPASAGSAESQTNSYTAGVICAKVARYAERIHHPERLLKPLVRAGGKGEGHLERGELGKPRSTGSPKSSSRRKRNTARETVWPYLYAGTMGLVQRDSIHRLRHAKRYSNQFDTICTNLAWTGFAMGAGAMRGSDPREMAKSDCMVIWGTNAVSPRSMS